MPIKTILFDLDGTLLPMDLEQFVQVYFRLLMQKMAENGYEPNLFGKILYGGVAAMLKNDGSMTNEAVFWQCLRSAYGDTADAALPILDEFYQNEFQQAKSVCGFDPAAADTVHRLKQQGYRLILATNPVFPPAATHSRIRWAGLEPEDFEYCTTYENASFSKPHPGYYREIVQKLGLAPEQCLMVGNDTADDMVAREVGMQVFLLTDYLINKQGLDISAFPNGGFEQLLQFIQERTPQ